METHIYMTEYGAVVVTQDEADLLNAHDIAHARNQCLQTTREIEARCLKIVLRREAFNKSRGQQQGD